MTAIRPLSSLSGTDVGLDAPRWQYVHWVENCLRMAVKLDKRSTEAHARSLGITRQIEVKELTELAILNRARQLAHRPGLDQQQRYNAIVQLYKNQVNLSHRTSMSVMLQQYSTPAPIAYLMGLFCLLNVPTTWAFEPSAGNGLLTIAGDPARCIVNEIDPLRRASLDTQGFYAVTGADATQAFDTSKWASVYSNLRVDAVLTNPPFGRLDEPKRVGPATIKDLDHWMAINAVDSHLKDNGRAAIIVGGHTEYDSNGSITAGKNRYFLNYLYHHYHVVDTINIDGDLYKRQGTSFNVRLILLSGRKAVPAGLSRPYDPEKDAIIHDFDTLYRRILPHTVPVSTPVLESTSNPMTADRNRLKMKLKLRAEALALGDGLLGAFPDLDTYGIDELPAEAMGGLGELTDAQQADVVYAVANRLIKAIAAAQQSGKRELAVTISSGRPHNLITGKAYQGANAQLLRAYVAQRLRTREERFVEEWQLSDRDLLYLERKGQEGETILVRHAGRVHGIRAYCITQVPSYWHLANKKYDNEHPIDSVEAIVGSFPLPSPRVLQGKEESKTLVKIEAHGAYYPQLDVVLMHPMTSFSSSAAYYRVLLHEMIHATGHTTRLNRPGVGNGSINVNKRDGAQEELIAEMGAALLCAEAGTLYQTLGRSASYVNYYLQQIKKGESVAFLSGFAGAQRAADYILGRMQPTTVYHQRMTTFQNRRNLAMKLRLRAQAIQVDELDGLGLPYLPASTAPKLDTDTPDAMAADVSQALASLRARVGSVDAYVQQKLGYANLRELMNALAAEQIDAVALAIDNVERLNQGIIIGDQTGIGKGRQAAAMIRYACHQGQTPVFFTEKPNLFTDLYRDLVAVGAGHLKPFIVNAREDKTTIRNENGNVAHRAPEKVDQDKAFASKSLPAGYDFVMLTYSQMNSGHRIDKKTGTVLEFSDKAGFVVAVSDGSLMVLDEAHNASGDSQTGKVLAGIMAKVSGVVYLSATFAKRPDNMFIYAMRTAMREVSLSPDEYAAAFAKGGVALQEVVAGLLVAQGQMIRRQRSFEGIEVNYIALDDTATAYGMPDKQREHRAISDEITRIIRRIIEFQKVYVAKSVKELDNQAKDEQGDVEIASGAKAAGVDNSPYFSKVFNVVNQMLFAIKADAVADRAIARLREGKKPVIAFSSTMGSFVEELFEDNQAGADNPSGDAIVNADFVTVLQRGLDGALRITKRDGWGKSSTRTLELHELPYGGEDEYYDIARDIRESVSGLVLSPIDLIKQRITAAGYSVAEVTGRRLEMQLLMGAEGAAARKKSGLGILPGVVAERPVGIIKARRKENVSEAFRRFNDNEVDVLLINQSGSTGASAHAIPTQKVPAHQVRQRVMIVLQAELDINTEVQKRGRINRTGQLHKPIYDYITSAIPAEKRLMMMLKKKLKSLDANTTSNQRNSEELLRSDDFLNKYGDKVMEDHLRENPGLNEELGGLLSDKTEDVTGLAHKASGRVAVLPTDKQEEFYAAVVDSYDKMIRRLRERDEYDLEVDTLDLQAKPATDSSGQKRLLVMGNGGHSAFGNSTWIEKLEVNNLRKPYKPEELQALVDAQLAGRSPEAYRDELRSDLQAYYSQQVTHYQEFFDKKMADDLADYEQSRSYQKLPASDQFRALALKRSDLTTGYDAKFQARFRALQSETGLLGEWFSYFMPGRMLQIELHGIKVPAVCVGVSIDRKKKHTFAAANVDILLAVASSQKMLTLGCSNEVDRIQLRAVQGVSTSMAYGWQNNRNEADYRAQRESWWRLAIKSGVSDRIVRYVVTGNLLQAYKGDALTGTGNGKIVTFSTIDGAQRRGILLPDGYSPDAKTNADGGRSAEQLVDVPIQKAERIIRGLVVERMVQTGTGCSLVKESLSSYKFIVPKGRHKDLYTDRMLLPMLLDEDGFNLVSNNMVARFAAADLSDVLLVLHQNHGMSVKLTQAQAGELAGELTPDKDTDVLPVVSPVPTPNPVVDASPVPVQQPVSSSIERERLKLKLKIRARAILLLTESL